MKPDGTLIAATVGNKHMKEMMDCLQQVHVDNVWKSYAVSFTLENGLEQLSLIFATLSLSRYEDNLKVTEIQPIMDYILSSSGQQNYRKMNW